MQKHRLLTTLLTVVLLLTPIASAVRADSMAPRMTNVPTDSQLHTWPDSQNISSSPAADSETPAVAATSTGVTHVVWEEDGALYHSYRDDHAWSEPSLIPHTSAAEAPVLAAVGDTVHLVYVHAIDIYHLSWNGVLWSLPKNVSQTSQVSDMPDLTVGSEGTLYMVWAEANGDIYYGQSAVGAVWSSSFIPSAEGSAPAVAVDAGGSIQVAWQEDWYTGQPEIHYSRREEGTWSLPQNMSFTPESGSTTPDLAVDSGGNTHLVWQETISATTQIQYSKRTTGWSDILSLSDDTQDAFAPSLVVDPEDRLHVAWDTAFPHSIRYTWTDARYDAWTPPATLASNPSERLLDVALYTGAGATVRAAWVEGVSAGEILYAEKQFRHLFLPFVSDGQ